MTNTLGPAAPILKVASVTASLAHYIEVLGFRQDWRADGMASVSRDRCTLFLCEWNQGQRGTWTWIGVGDAAALHDTLAARGARIRHPPTNFPWALEMQVEDLDGNVLRLGSEPLAGVAYGSFLDAAGALWPTE
jgi:hypothetical protein